MEWEQLESSPEYKALTRKEKTAVKLGYFKDNIEGSPEWNSLDEPRRMTVVNNFFADEIQQPERTLGGTLKDIGLSTVKGIVGLGESAVGLLDIPTFGMVGKGLEKIGYDPQETNRILESGYSPAQQYANRQLENSGGFLDTAKTMLEYPSTIGHSVVESAPSMLGGAALARGALGLGLKVSPVIAGALGEGAVSAGQTAEQARQSSESGFLSPEKSAMALASGAITSAIGAAGGRLAKKFGFADVDTMLASGQLGVTNHGVFRRILEGGITEGVFEELPQSVQEQVWANAATGRPLGEGVPQAGAQGMFAGAAMGAGGNVLGFREQSQLTPPQIETVDKIDTGLTPPNIQAEKPDRFEFPPQTDGEQKAMEDEILLQRDPLQRARSQRQAEIVKQDQKDQAKERAFRMRRKTQENELERLRRNQETIDQTNIDVENEFSRLATEGRKFRQRPSREAPSVDQQAEQAMLDNREAYQRINTLSKLWDSLNDQDKPKAEAEIGRLQKQLDQLDQVEAQRIQKEASRDFRRRSKDERMIEAQRQLKESDRLNLDIPNRSELEKTAYPEQTQPQEIVYKRNGAWVEDAFEDLLDDAHEAGRMGNDKPIAEDLTEQQTQKLNSAYESGVKIQEDINASRIREGTRPISREISAQGDTTGESTQARETSGGDQLLVSPQEISERVGIGFKPGDTVKYNRGKYNIEEIEDERAIISNDSGEQVVSVGQLSNWRGRNRQYAPEKPKPIGTVWTGNSWRPFVEQSEITRGKSKGKFRVTLPDGSKIVAEHKAIRVTPQEQQPEANAPSPILSQPIPSETPQVESGASPAPPITTAPVKTEPQGERTLATKYVGEDGYDTWYDSEGEAEAALSSMKENGLNPDKVSKAYYPKTGDFKYKIYRTQDEINRINKAFRSKQEKEESEKRKIEERDRIDRENTDGFADGLSPMQRGKVIASLNRRMKFNKGELMSVKDKVRQLVESGEAKPEAVQEDAIKPMSRTRWNRADQKDQDAHERKRKAAGKKTVYYVGNFDLGKTAYDYANHLLNNKKESVNETDFVGTDYTPTTPADPQDDQVAPGYEKGLMPTQKASVARIPIETRRAFQEEAAKYDATLIGYENGKYWLHDNQTGSSGNLVSTVAEIGPKIEENRKVFKGLQDSLKNENGSSQIITDISAHGVNLIRDGIDTLQKFRAAMKERFSNVWDKIKDHMRGLWDILSKPLKPAMNQRGEITIRQGKEQPEKQNEAKEQINKEIPSIVEKVSIFIKNPKLTQEYKKDLSYVGDLLSSMPSFFADKIPAVKKIFDASQDRQDEFHEGIHWMENHDDSNVVDMWKRLEKTDKQKAAQYIVQNDRDMKGFRVAQRKSGKWVALGLTGQKIAEFESDITEDGIDKGEVAAVEKIVQAEAEHLAETGYSPEQVAAITGFRLSTNKGFDLLFLAMRKMIASAKTGGVSIPKIPTFENGKRVQIDLTQAMARMNDIRGYYYPRIRKPGKYVLRAFKEGEYNILETFSIQRTMNVRKLGLEKQGYKVETGKNTQLGEDVFEMAGKLVATQQIVNAALEKVDQRLKTSSKEDIENIEKEVESIFATALSEQIANIIRERGSRVHMTRRSQDVYVGYEEDPQIAIAKYIRGVAAGEAKRNMVMKMLRAMTGTDVSWSQYKSENKDSSYDDYRAMVKENMIDQREQKNAFKWAKAYIGENTRNQEAADRAIGIVKGVAVAKYLAFRVFSAPLVNLTALPTSAVASMKAAGIPYTSTWRHLGAAMRDYGKYRAGKKLSSEQKAVFDHIRQKGWDNPQFNSEALSTLRGVVGRRYDKIIEYGMWTFSESERLNRAATIAATYNGLRKNDSKTSFADLMDKAKQTSDYAHGIYNRGNYPYIALGRHPAALVTKMFYVFRTFSHTYLNNLYRVGFKEKDRVALTHMLVSPAIIAGAGASVLTPVIAAMLKAIGVDEPEEQAYLKIGEMFGPGAENVARFGITSLAPGGGVSMKGSLSIGITDIPTSLTVKDFLGAPGSVIDEMFFQSPSSIARGDVAKGIEKLLPTGFGNIIRAYREGTEGITTRNNAPVFYGNDQLKLNLVESIYRGMSFNPARVAGIREKQYKERKIESDYRERRTDIYAKIKRYTLEGSKDQEKWAELLGEIEQYNEEAARWNLTPITNKSIKSNLKRSFRPSKRERMRD